MSRIRTLNHPMSNQTHLSQLSHSSVEFYASIDVSWLESNFHSFFNLDCWNFIYLKLAFSSNFVPEIVQISLINLEKWVWAFPTFPSKQIFFWGTWSDFPDVQTENLAMSKTNTIKIFESVQDLGYLKNLLGQSVPFLRPSEVRLG